MTATRRSWPPRRTAPWSTRPSCAPWPPAPPSCWRRRRASWRACARRCGRVCAYVRACTCRCMHAGAGVACGGSLAAAHCLELCLTCAHARMRTCSAWRTWPPSASARRGGAACSWSSRCGAAARGSPAPAHGLLPAHGHATAWVASTWAGRAAGRRWHACCLAHAPARACCAALLDAGCLLRPPAGRFGGMQCDVAFVGRARRRRRPRPSGVQRPRRCWRRSRGRAARSSSWRSGCGSWGRSRRCGGESGGGAGARVRARARQGASSVQCATACCMPWQNALAGMCNSQRLKFGWIWVSALALLQLISPYWYECTLAAAQAMRGTRRLREQQLPQHPNP